MGGNISRVSQTVSLQKGRELTAVCRSGVVMTAEAGSAGNAYVESSYKNVSPLHSVTVVPCLSIDISGLRQRDSSQAFQNLERDPHRLASKVPRRRRRVYNQQRRLGRHPLGILLVHPPPRRVPQQDSIFEPAIWMGRSWTSG